MFLAHIRGEDCQSAADHCRNTARYVRSCLKGVGLEKAGTLMGLVHDCGKFKREFQDYLLDPNGVRGSVNHTFAGTRLLMERYHDSENGMERLVAELLAFAVGSHHGLFDCVDENRNSGFLHRMRKENIGYSESKRNFYAQCIPERELDALFDGAVDELSRVFQLLACTDYSECQFRLGLLERLLLSALVEGDRRDTAEFMTDIQLFPDPGDWHRFWTPYLERVEKKLAGFPVDTAICKARREISDRCRAMAEERGAFTA